MIKRVPIDINEMSIHQILDDTDDIGRTLSRAARVARENANRLADLGAALEADPTLPDGMKRARLREAALSLGERVAAELDKARSVAEAEARSVASATAAPPAPRDPAGLAIEGELRSALRSMTFADRRKALEADDRVLGAALRGPALLSGLGEAEAAAAANSYRSRAHPQAAQRLDRLERAQAAVDRVGKSFMGYVGKAASLGELDARQAELTERTTAAVKGERAA